MASLVAANSARAKVATWRGTRRVNAEPGEAAACGTSGGAAGSGDGGGGTAVADASLGGNRAWVREGGKGNSHHKRWASRHSGSDAGDAAPRVLGARRQRLDEADGGGAAGSGASMSGGRSPRARAATASSAVTSKFHEAGGVVDAPLSAAGVAEAPADAPTRVARRAA